MTIDESSCRCTRSSWIPRTKQTRIQKQEERISRIRYLKEQRPWKCGSAPTEAFIPNSVGTRNFHWIFGPIEYTTTVNSKFSPAFILYFTKLLFWRALSKSSIRQMALSTDTFHSEYFEKISFRWLKNEFNFILYQLFTYIRKKIWINSLQLEWFFL